MLVVNKIDRLPLISITNILRTCDSQIVVGYIDRKDIGDIPQNPRITFIDLGPDFKDLNFKNLSKKNTLQKRANLGSN
jgi:hypothetical protein